MRTHVAHKLVNTTQCSRRHDKYCGGWGGRSKSASFWWPSTAVLRSLNRKTKSSACRLGRDHWLARWLNIVLIYSTLSHTREVLPTGCRCFAFGYEARSAEKRIIAPGRFGPITNLWQAPLVASVSPSRPALPEVLATTNRDKCN